MRVDSRNLATQWLHGHKGSQMAEKVGSTYLIGLLLTGARHEELAGLKRADIDYQWNRMTIADKYGQTRKIPLAPHFKRMLLELPVVEGNPYVFVSETSARGHISEPRSVLDRVQKRAGIEHMTVHGLRCRGELIYCRICYTIRSRSTLDLLRVVYRERRRKSRWNGSEKREGK